MNTPKLLLLPFISVGLFLSISQCLAETIHCHSPKTAFANNSREWFYNNTIDINQHSPEQTKIQEDALVYEYQKQIDFIKL